MIDHPRSLISSIIYVGAIYLSNLFIHRLKKSNSFKTQHLKFTRDDPFVIKTRIIFVSISTILTYVYLYYYRDSHMDIKQFVDIMQNQHGLIPTYNNILPFFKEVFSFISLGMILYSSEIIDRIIGNYVSSKTTKSFIKSTFFKYECDIWFIRSCLFAPITEELIFTLVLQEDYNNRVIFMNSVLYFGIAHLHHGYELYVDDSNAYSLMNITISCLVQLIYTSLFGHISNVIYSQKSQYSKIVNSIIIHSICNYFSFPSITTTGLYFCEHRINKKIKWGYEIVHKAFLLFGLYIFLSYIFW
ncbi:uncharacterized protein HGUI_01313 [Hanseniaspora guilliermondii]|uniref:intramembrane prenyl-peptidase Rce1 n=1 Tax=Hanseniaspora guilliermondii TaxID=56406 RepID=A0A1L0CL38_9ASCO|nr:uncharacterized protein HGUI_01313 [Hanseniaspora guilliermondii]